jgi:hypothetical protein
MVVIPLASLPLTVNLRIPSVCSDNKGQPSRVVISAAEEAHSLESVLQTLARIVAEGVGDPDLVWSSDYSFRNLWTSDFPVKSAKTGKTTFHKFDRLPPGRQYSVLWAETYFTRRLKPENRLKLRALLDSGHKGTLRFKEILHYSDAIVSGFLIGFPEVFLKHGVYRVSDRLHNSVISLCLNQQLQFEIGLKKLRKELRFHMLNKVPFDPSCFRGKGKYRAFSFFAPFVDALNGIHDRNSRDKMFRLAMITQTRAAGLASPMLVKKCLQEFEDTVSVKRDFTPNPLLLAAIDQITSEIAESPEFGRMPNLKISISTAACRESNRSKGGKYNFARKLAKDILYPREHLDLFYDEASFAISDDDDDILLSTLDHFTFGEIVWELAFDVAEAITSTKDRKVNVSCVRENGKARVVTSGSFWKDALLQPFSHLTIEMCKVVKCISSAFRASKHGWQWICDLEEWEPLKDASFEGFYTYCSDWEKATDAPPPGSGRALTGLLLKKIGLPDHVTNVMLETWLGNKVAYMGGQPKFIIRNGIMMGDPLTKTNLCLAHAVCERYARIQLKILDPMYPFAAYGRGNGDDLAWIYNHTQFPKFYSEAASMLGYKESQLDTFVSKDWLFYCEEYFYIPQHRLNYVSVSQKHKNPDLLPYLDYPRLRLMIDTQKDREDFSSSTIGKFTLLGKEISYLPPEGVPYHFYQLASAIQDVSLDVFAGDECPILPHQFFGVGKPVVGYSLDSLKNFLSHAPAWKRKFLKAVIYETMFETYYLLNFRGSVVVGQKHFSGESSVGICTIPEEDPIHNHALIKKEELHFFPPGVVERLVSSGDLIYESGIWKYYMMNRRFVGLVDDEAQYSLFSVIRHTLNTFEEMADFDDVILEGFLERWQKRHYTFRRLIPEDVYDMRTVKELLFRDPIRINSFGFDLSPVLDRFKTEPTDNTFLKESRRLYAWLREIVGFDDDDYPVERCEFLKQGRLEYGTGPPTSILEDDPIIVRDVCSSPNDLVLIVTNDIKLHRLCKNKAYGKIILRVPVSCWLKTPGEDGDKINYCWARYQATCWVDSGNVLGYSNRIAEGGRENILSARFDWKHNLIRDLTTVRNPMMSAGRSLYDIEDPVGFFGTEEDIAVWERYLEIGFADQQVAPVI